jgi:L-ascorbate 6-phosphate lactonase
VLVIGYRVVSQRINRVFSIRCSPHTKAVVGVLGVALGGAGFAVPQANRSETVLEQIRSHHQGIAVWWVGNAGWLIKAGDLLIGTDLD